MVLTEEMTSKTSVHACLRDYIRLIIRLSFCFISFIRLDIVFTFCCYFSWMKPGNKWQYLFRTMTSLFLIPNKCNALINKKYNNTQLIKGLKLAKTSVWSLKFLWENHIVICCVTFATTGSIKPHYWIFILMKKKTFFSFLKCFLSVALRFPSKMNIIVIRSTWFWGFIFYDEWHNFHFITFFVPPLSLLEKLDLRLAQCKDTRLLSPMCSNKTQTRPHTYVSMFISLIWGFSR